jgi:hypothetical protein
MKGAMREWWAGWWWAQGVVAILIVGSFACPSFAYAAGDVNRSDCPAATESSPGFRSYLPDCRAYELVSPPYTEGGLLMSPAPEAAALAENGEDLVVGVAGAFGGVENEPFDGNRSPDWSVFHLARGEAGWRYAALNPPSTPYKLSALLAVSADSTLSTTLWGAQTGNLALHKEALYMEREEAGGGLTFTRVGPGETPELESHEIELGVEEELTPVGASNDLTHLALAVEDKNVGGYSTLWPGDATVEGQSLYEYIYNGTENAEPTLVGVENAGPPPWETGATHVNQGAKLISNCGTELGGGRGRSMYNAVSKDGETVFFTAHECGGSPAVNEVWARVDGEHAVKISEPVLPGGAAGECTGGEPCAGAELKNGEFKGADEGGRRVFFTSEQPLVNGVPVEGKKLYEERLEGAKVVEVLDLSNPPGFTGVNPKVQGVVRVGENGERVYFVAKEALAGQSAEHRLPEREAFNLYVYEPDIAHPGSHHVVFVVRLLTNTVAGNEEEATIAAAEAKEKEEVFELEQQAKETAEREALGKGATPQEAEKAGIGAETVAEETLPGTLGPAGPGFFAGTLAEDRHVWRTTDERPAQATPDGRFLVFSSSADLLGEGLPKVPQLFEYDAVAGRLTRVSIGQGGVYDKNGAVSTFHTAAKIPQQSFQKSDLPMTSRMRLAVSNDGSRVLFTSAAPLTPGAQAGSTNVYEYREGNVYLVSDGRDSASEGSLSQPAVQLWGTDPSGGDAFFTTADALVPQLGQTQTALYDARSEGGFPAPTLLPGCVGEACRGETGLAPQLGLAGSASQTAGDNVRPSPPKPKSPTRAQKLSRALSSCRKKYKESKSKRVTCERQAQRQYGAKVARRTTRQPAKLATRP